MQHKVRHNFSVQPNNQLQHMKMTVLNVRRHDEIMVISSHVPYRTTVGNFLFRPLLEPTIYRTRDEHANHYATDAVSLY